MTKDEIAEYDAQRINLAQAKEEIKAAWDDFDHYEFGMRVIDTDYTSFLLLYQCREEYEGVDDIETALTTDKDYNKIHHQAISILVRDPTSMSEERIEELIQTLKEKVPGHDFSLSHERQV